MGQALTEREIEAVVREVTDEEVAFYHEYGWVMMKQLVDSAFATELLRVGQEWLKRNRGPPDGPSAWRDGKRPSRSARSCSASACQRTQRDS